MHACVPVLPMTTQCTGQACSLPGGNEESIKDTLDDTLQAQQLLLELQAGILKDSGLQDKQRARICTALAEADKCLVDGSDEFLQLLHVASVAQQAIQGAA